MIDSSKQFPTIQVTQLTSTPFKFNDSTQVEVPLAPLVSAKLYARNGIQTLKVRATLYIDATNTTPPFVAQPIENASQLSVYYDYDNPEKTPISYLVWYVEFDYTSATVEKITSIISFLKDLDPETSRGTEVSVQH